MIMHSRRLISILVWVAVLCFTRVVPEFYSELADTLNTMLRDHPGWRDDMHDVKVSINDARNISDPMSAILGALSSNRNPVDRSNAMSRYKEVWTILMCKYAEIVYKYKLLIKNYIWVCQNEQYTPPPESSFQRYRDCFRLLLAKLHGVSPRFKFMHDALDYFYTLVPQGRPKHSVMIAMDKLTKYTSTVGPETSAKLSAHGTTEHAVDQEIKNIGDYTVEVYNKNVYQYARAHCVIPRGPDMAAQKFEADFHRKKRSQQLPQEMTMIECIVNELDCFVSEIFDRWFYNLGFAYGPDGKVTIRIIN